MEAEQQSENLVFRHRVVVRVEKRCQALHASVELRVSREDGRRPRFAGDAPDGVVPCAEQGERRFLGNSIVHEQLDAAVAPRWVSELGRPLPGVAYAQIPGGNYSQSAVGDVDFAPTLPAQVHRQPHPAGERGRLEGRVGRDVWAPRAGKVNEGDEQTARQGATAHGAASDRFRDLQFEEALGILNQLDSRGDPRFQELSVGLSIGACAAHGTIPFQHVPMLCGSGDCIFDS